MLTLDLNKDYPCGCQLCLIAKRHATIDRVNKIAIIMVSIVMLLCAGIFVRGCGTAALASKACDNYPYLENTLIDTELWNDIVKNKIFKSREHITAHAMNNWCLNLIILAIIGEAEGESYQGKLAVAYAIINRGTLQGVYGLRSPRVTGHKYSQNAYNEALNAYKQALNHPLEDITHGATGWGTWQDIQTLKHLTGFYVTDHIGNHYFYSVVG